MQPPYHSHAVILPVNKKSTYMCSYKIAYKEIFVILQSLGIIIIKSKETKSVIYACRYSSGQFNP